MRASKRPYCELDKELSPVTKAIKIPVSMAESINAWDINPNNSKKYVIYLHGFAQNLTSNQPLYKALSKTDFGILAIDYRGYGKNPHTKHFSDNDIVQDVKASIEYLKNKGVKDIGLVGHSFGGYISAKTSNSNKLGFQILVSPMISLEFWLKKVVKFPKRNKKESLFVKYIPSYKNMYSKVFDINEHIRHNLTPTYVIQGRKDAYVRTSKVKEMTKQVPELKEFVVINSSKHRMDNDKISEIVRVLKKL
jgi:hypothetical protein